MVKNIFSYILTANSVFERLKISNHNGKRKTKGTSEAILKYNNREKAQKLADSKKGGTSQLGARAAGLSITCPTCKVIEYLRFL